jgi:hypothetical protein
MPKIMSHAYPKLYAQAEIVVELHFIPFSRSNPMDINSASAVSSTGPLS